MDSSEPFVVVFPCFVLCAQTLKQLTAGADAQFATCGDAEQTYTAIVLFTDLDQVERSLATTAEALHPLALPTPFQLAEFIRGLHPSITHVAVAPSIEASVVRTWERNDVVSQLESLS